MHTRTGERATRTKPPLPTTGTKTLHPTNPFSQTSKDAATTPPLPANYHTRKRQFETKETLTIEGK